MNFAAATLNTSPAFTHTGIYTQHVNSQTEGAYSRGQHRAISEIIVPNFTDNRVITNSIVASLTQQPNKRWITWITSARIDKQQLLSLGANVSSLRIVYVENREDARWIIWQALSQGTSTQVIAEQECFSASDVLAMESAAQQGNCNGVLVSIGRGK
ncbi:hypothetical protein ACVBE9_05050 [Eionea flava]